METPNRYVLLHRGEAKLRSFLPEATGLRCTLVFSHESRHWAVLAQVLPEGRPPILLGGERIEEFPSDVMVAQTMLLS